jgi:uroporphyrinogen-III synthase
MARLLVLRPEPAASATVREARRRGLDAISTPLFEIEPVDWVAPDAGEFDGLLLTSANAIRHAGEQLAHLRKLEVHAVGDATAEAAGNAGFEIASRGSSGIDELLVGIDPGLRLLHLCGADRRTPRDGSQEITPIVVYRSKEIDAPNLPSAGNVALIHSPRAARRFAELATGRQSIAIVAISQAAADAVGAGWKSVTIAAEPNDDALLALAASLCNKPDPK